MPRVPNMLGRFHITFRESTWFADAKRGPFLAGEEGGALDALRFLQVSDLALGQVPELEGEIPFDERRRIVTADRRRVLDRLVTVARDFAPSIVLLPGDLIDDAWATPEDAEELSRALVALGPIPVIVAPGEVDPPHCAGYLRQPCLELMGRCGLPEHVTVFESSKPTTIKIGPVAVTGWATSPADAGSGGAVRPEGGSGKDGAESSRPPPLQDLVPSSALVRSALYHLVVAHQLPVSHRRSVTPDRLVTSGVHYLALGHSVEPSLERDIMGSVRIGKTGHPVIRGIPGGGGVILVGKIRSDHTVVVETVATAARRAFVVSVDVSATASTESLATELASLLSSQKIRSQDLVRIRLSGHWQGAGSPSDCSALLDPHWTHLVIDQDAIELNPESAGSSRSAHLMSLRSSLDSGDERVRARALWLAQEAWSGREVTLDLEDPPSAT